MDLAGLKLKLRDNFERGAQFWALGLSQFAILLLHNNYEYAAWTFARGKKCFTHCPSG
jgi:hypothetical protein